MDSADFPAKTQADRLQQAYEGGTIGDRVQIAMRNQARKELSDMFTRITRYLEAVTEPGC